MAQATEGVLQLQSLTARPLAVLGRPQVQAVALYLISLFLNLYRLSSFQPALDHFERWVLRPTSLWSLVFVANDTNTMINAFPWEVLVHASTRLLGETPLAVRLPSALICALSPLLLAQLVRRLFRQDVAFAAGVLLACSHYQLVFARSGGYVGVTLTLLLGIFLSSVLVLNGRRLAWVPLTALVVLMPYFYAPIRYVSLLAFPAIAYKVAVSREFRRRHLWCAAVSAVVVCLCYLPNVLFFGGVPGAAVNFYEARGEQLLFVRGTWSSEVRGQWITRLRELFEYYVSGRGHRFFGWRHEDLAVRRTFLVLLGLGWARSLAAAWRSPRYLLAPLWSLWTCLPLLLTTGISPNRLFLSLPADTFLMTLGAITPSDLVARLLPRRLRWLCYLPFAALVVWASVQGVKCYFGLWVGW